MDERYWVRLCKESLVFSAAHFITFGANICERLHGHNYRVNAEVHGPLNEHQYVIDFIALRDTLQQLVLELDHHVILPTDHPHICITPSDREVLVTFEERRWIFPRVDCVLLPVANTTAELLASYLGRQFLAQDPRRVTIGDHADSSRGRRKSWAMGLLAVIYLGSVEIQRGGL